MLSDSKGAGAARGRGFGVSMHLLVLSAFRLTNIMADRNSDINKVSMHLLVLSAFRLERGHVGLADKNVSMHLLVLSAFRRTTISSWTLFR